VNAVSPLTKERAKPAVYFGGPYRIIDFTLSNCLNSGCATIFIALQYKSLSLTRHLRFGWSVVADELGEFIEVLHPQKRVGEHWYQGHRGRRLPEPLLRSSAKSPRHLIVLSGDHVYKMDYARMLRFHLDRGAGATLAVLEVAAEEAHRFGIMQVDDNDRLTGLPREARRPAAGPATSRRWGSTSST
jgi:glucose-1-phosphate adenylyltransferase